MESDNNFLLFTKMHGIGNDYVYLDCTASVPDNLPQLARILSDRHTGIGGDGIILILPSDIADFKMRIFNADGSEARMCGNGSRCVGKYVSDYGLTDKSQITLETLSGIKHLTLHRGTDGQVTSVTVDMGVPSFNCDEIGMNVTGPNGLYIDSIPEPTDSCPTPPCLTAVSMGNPHGVVFFSENTELTDKLVATTGPALENHPMWTDRANIEFVRLAGPAELDMRVWERGSGETMACGTGACAATVAAIATGRVVSRKVKVNLPGGTLEIEWRPTDKHVLMTGPAVTVFEGRYRIPLPAIIKE